MADGRRLELEASRAEAPRVERHRRRRGQLAVARGLVAQRQPREFKRAVGIDRGTDIFFAEYADAGHGVTAISPQRRGERKPRTAVVPPGSIQRARFSRGAAWRRSAPNSLNIEPQSTRRTPRKSKNNFEMLRVFADAIDIRNYLLPIEPALFLPFLCVLGGEDFSSLNGCAPRR